MFAAVYARVSTGLQVEGTSLESQVDLCQKKAKEIGFSSDRIKIYKEEGFSGEDIDRPEMNRLREDVKKGLISYLVIMHPDRLSRDLTDKLFVCRELDSMNVNLVFVDAEYKNTPEGQLFFNLISVIAQYELSLIRKRTVNGRLRAVEKEKKIMPMRVPPYGYDLIDGELKINEVEAEFVKKIYQWYVNEHLTLREIGNRLYEQGALPKRRESKNWGASSIRRILTSPIYIGKYIYNRRKTQKVKGQKTASGAPKKTYDLRPEDDWIVIDVPAIVDNEIYEQAQIRKEKNLKNSGNVKYDYLLKSLIRCGHCGRLWQSTTYSGRLKKKMGERARYRCYRCPNLFPKKYGKEIEKCPSKSLKAEMIEEYIWNLIVDAISEPSLFKSRLKEQSESVVKELHDAISVLNKQIDEKQQEKGRVKVMFRRNFIDETEMAGEFQEINKELDKLQKEVDKYQKQINDYGTKQLSEGQIERLSGLVLKGLQDDQKCLTLENKRYIVETLIDEIIVKYKGDELQITTVGALDEIIREQQNKADIVHK